MENLQPKLRFPEFKDIYRRKSLGEISKISSGKSKKDEVNNHYPLFGSTGIIGFSTESDYSGERILVARVGANAGYIYKINGIYGVSDNTLMISEVTENIDFMYYQLKQENLNKYIFGSGQPLITGTILKKLVFYIPTLQEQTKIADFLGAVDKQLDILNQKKEKLNTYKKGVMQQLFAQQLRFKDDNGNNYPDWQEKTLGEVLKYTQPNKFIVKSTDYNNNFNIPVLTAGKSFLLGFTNETDNIYKEIPCIIFDDFTTSSQFVDFEFKIKSSAMKILNTIGNDNIKFLFELISTIHFPTGDEHKRYWISEYSKLKLSIPSIEEQTKIAEFLSAIDKQIEAVENQITKTETYKKGLLQQMFV